MVDEEVNRWPEKLVITFRSIGSQPRDKKKKIRLKNKTKRKEEGSVNKEAHRDPRQKKKISGKGFPIVALTYSVQSTYLHIN
jgi:hypothetical protein